MFYSFANLSDRVCFYAGENHEPLSWDLRVNIALDIARGLEYLHDGVTLHHLCT